MSQRIISLTLSGDVGTKGAQTRSAFRRRLRANIRDTLARHALQARICDRRDRIELEGGAEDAEERLTTALSRVFGIQQVRVAQRMPWRGAEDIVALGEQLYADAVAGRRFAVRVRRVGPRAHIPVDGGALAAQLGERLVVAGGRVDLDHPEVRVPVEVRPDDALFIRRTVPGAHGLPVGVQGRALALISGGYDSAVAAWQMLRRGVALDFLLFNLAGWPQEQAVRQVLSCLDRDWMGGTRPGLHIVDFRPVVAEMRRRVPGRYWQVLLKRLMLRAAESVAEALGSQALVTGDALGQVSSQTLSNLDAISAHARTMVLRPLLGHDKDEIIERAQAIGIAEISAEVEEFCALAGASPATRLRREQLDRQEARFGGALVDKLAARYRSVPRNAFGDALANTPEIERVPEHSAVFDLRSEAEYERWHWPGAIHLEFDRALEHADKLPRDRAYLFYCEVGLKSAHLAERMRESGFEAYSFRGGVEPLQAYARRHADDARLSA
jgi:thiamine biosynthesis protein ThiI